jgi:hypothetical protein
MYPHPTRSISRPLALILAGLLAAPAIAPAQQQDAPPVDVGQLLQSLRAMRQQQATQLLSQKQTAWQRINAAAGSNEAATTMWENAVRATQMEGAGKENSQFKTWKDTEGESFKEREVQNAVRLHIQWLAFTLQRSGGAKVKDMLPSLISYTKELLADEIGMDALVEAIKREKELGAANPKRAQRSRDDAATKKAHDAVLNRGLGGSVVVQWLKLNDFINVEHWELNPGNLDGIYKNIILPELRAQRDQRVFEYWDMKLKKEADKASQSKLAFEIEKFNTLRRPALLWNRSEEYISLGLKNKAVSEMFALIKAYPTHPDADEWVDKLEQVLLPPAPATPVTDPSAASPGTTTAPTTPAPAPVPVPGS